MRPGTETGGSPRGALSTQRRRATIVSPKRRRRASFSIRSPLLAPTLPDPSRAGEGFLLYRASKFVRSNPQSAVPETTDILPLTEVFSPGTQEELAAVVRRAYESRTPIYPLGGGTSLDFGLAPKAPGWGLSLARINRVVDYPARDMTITVEAGITMSALAETLAGEGQRLPIDAPHAFRATLGGVVATNTSGPRRYGGGTVRDYVIGISAVDGRGVPFKGGGRVVKNVAGYDFCKLLTGSLGTLAVITQVTLKLKPLAEAAAFVACDVPDLDRAETLLAALVTSQTTPTAIELLSGPAWNDDAALGPAPPRTAARLAVGLEGTRPEVDWMIEQLAREWYELGVAKCHVISVKEEVDSLWRRLTEFAVDGEPPMPKAPLVLKASLLPSKVCDFCRRLREMDPGCSIQSHAGNGIVLARLAEFAPADSGRVLIVGLQPAAAACGGNVIVLSCAAAAELTRQAIWGGAGADAAVMQAVKQQFDPRGILNPGRLL
jgi:glycolate dehydrogenase FAD-binding subunit